VPGEPVGSADDAVSPAGVNAASACATSAWLRVRVESPNIPEPISVTAASVTPVATNATASQPATAFTAWPEASSTPAPSPPDRRRSKLSLLG
jgi:hypothetical protein